LATEITTEYLAEVDFGGSLAAPPSLSARLEMKDVFDTSDGAGHDCAGTEVPIPES